MVTVLLVDFQAVLDRSETGRQASRTLVEGLREHRDPRRLERQRDAMCQALIGRAQRVLEQIVAGRDAIVVDRRAWVTKRPAEDVTEELIRRVDALGPLRRRVRARVPA